MCELFSRTTFPDRVPSSGWQLQHLTFHWWWRMVRCQLSKCLQWLLRVVLGHDSKEADLVIRQFWGRRWGYTENWCSALFFDETFFLLTEWALYLSPVNWKIRHTMSLKHLLIPHLQDLFPKIIWIHLLSFVLWNCSSLDHPLPFRKWHLSNDMLRKLFKCWLFFIYSRPDPVLSPTKATGETPYDFNGSRIRSLMNNCPSSTKNQHQTQSW